MKTLLKHAVGQSVEPLIVPPAAAKPTLYQSEPRSRRTRLRLAVRVFSGLILAAVAAIAGVGGGAFLWFDRSVATVEAHSPALKRAAKQLSLPLPGQPAIAMLLGIDTRAGTADGSDNTDTIMLVRADPKTHTISLLSFPRDLNVPIYCSGSTVAAQGRINSALAICGPKGALDTVGHLTGLPINYLVTVDFHGFKAIVDKLGGVWIDVDRTYYNKNVGTASTDYSNIDLQPGYQLLTGGAALAFVRFRHTDSDLYRLAREQEFVHAIKDQIASNFDPFKLPGIVSAITSNVQVASKGGLSDKTVLEYALFAATLPAGHVVESSIDPSELEPLDVGGADELSASPAAVAQAVSAFIHPQVVGAKKPAAPRPAPVIHRPVHHAPPAPSPADTSLTVLNGNGVPGAATVTSSALAARGYRILPPPGGVPANAPSMTYPETEIYFNPKLAKSAAAARPLAALFKPAQLQALPADPALRALDPDSMVLVVLGHNFSGTLPTPTAPPASSLSEARQETAVSPPPVITPQVEAAASATEPLIAPLARKAGFKLELPTLLGSGSAPDDLNGDQPVRLYTIVSGHKALRLVYVTGDSQYWGIEETGWSGAPVLGDDNLSRTFHGRSYSLYYAAGHLHMVVLHAYGATYWVVNTLLNELSNPTMIAIAEGLRPLGANAT